MLRYIYANDFSNHVELLSSMYRDRAWQFKDRLGWDVTIDQNGFERDQYDDLNPVYGIWELLSVLHFPL